MVSTSYRILGEVLHLCSKCKLTLNHRITLMNGDRPAKVLCLTCKTERSYRDSGAPRRDAVRKVSGLTKTAAPAARGLEATWRASLSDPMKTPKPYDPSTSFALDEHVYHAVFGRGVIIGFIHPDKIQVFFEEGLKTLKGKKA